MLDSSQDHAKGSDGYPRLARLLHLMQLLSARYPADASEIAEILGVSRRTVFRDLKTLQEAGVPLAYDSTLRKYQIFHPPKLLATQHSPEMLTVAVALIGSQLSRVLRKAAAFLAIEIPHKLGRADRESLLAAIDWLDDERDPDPEPFVWEYLHTLFQGFKERKKVRITYYDPSRSSICTLLSPYRLINTNTGWELSGKSSLHGTIIRVQANQLVAAEKTDDSFLSPGDF